MPPTTVTPQDAATLHTAGGGGAVDAVVGGIWPERESRPQPRLLGGALVVGAVGALVLPDHDLGLGVLLTLLLSGGLVLSASPLRRARWTVLSAVLCVALGLLLVWRANGAVAVLAVFAAAALTTTSVTRASGLLAMVASGVAWVGAGVRGLPLLSRTLASMSRHRLLWPVVRTAAISAAALLVFGGLFASADAVLGAWADALVPDLALDGLVFRVFVGFFVAGVTLAGCYLALNPPALDRLRVRDARPTASPWEWQVPLALVIASFLAFLAAQGAAVFGGHDYLRRTTGLTYADYVHQGFGQLVVATLLTLVVLALVRRKASVVHARDRLTLRAMGGLLCLLTLLVVASALHRLWLYEQAYGFTTLRLFVTGVELWLGVLVGAVLVAGVRLRTAWLPRAALLSGALFTLGFGAMNPDGWVAAHNLDRYVATGRLDPAYLRSLGDDAVPAIVGAGLPADLTACLVGARPGDAVTTSPADLVDWNRGRSLARTLRAEHPASTTTTCDQVFARLAADPVR